MSYYLIDFGSPKIDFNFDNLIIGRKIKTDQENHKYYIYYQKDQNETPKEIFIRLPRLRLIYNLANQKFNQLNIPIYPNWDLTNNFIKFIQNLESDINECFINKKTNKEWISIINKKNSLNFIKTSTYDKYKTTSDIEDKKITLNDFKINGQIDVVIKLSYVWCKNNKMGLSSQLYQIKYFAPPDQLDINFIDPVEPKPKQIYGPPIPPPLPFLNQLKEKELNPEDIITKSMKLAGKPASLLPPQIGLKIIPDVKDLQKAIKDLKPVINKE